MHNTGIKTAYRNEPRPLLGAGPQVACGRTTIFGTDNSPNYCVSFVGKKIRNTWTFLKRGGAQECRRSVEPIV